MAPTGAENKDDDVSGDPVRSTTQHTVVELILKLQILTSGPLCAADSEALVGKLEREVEDLNGDLREAYKKMDGYEAELDDLRDDLAQRAAEGRGRAGERLQSSTRIDRSGPM